MPRKLRLNAKWTPVAQRGRMTWFARVREIRKGQAPPGLPWCWAIRGKRGGHVTQGAGGPAASKEEAIAKVERWLGRETA